MRITEGFQIKDIIEYEATNRVDIRKELMHGEMFVVIDMIAIGNKCTIEDALDKLKNLQKHYEYKEIVEELAIEIFGKQAEENDEVVESNDKSLTDILTDFYNELQTLDDKLSLSEFLSMNTSYMYKYAEGVKSRYLFNKNKALRDEFDSACVYWGVFGGKVKKAPQIKESDLKTPKQLKEERIQEMRERRQKRLGRSEI